MNLKFVLLFAVIVSFLVAPQTGASKVKITLKDAAGQAIDSSNPFSSCPGPITPQSVAVLVKNTGSSSDTYTMKLTSLPPGWSGAIQSQVPLAAGEERGLSLLLINMPPPHTLLPGVYSIKIEAKSTSGDKDEVTLPLNILACNAVSVVPVTAQQQLCEEAGGSASYTVEIANTGKFQETFSLIPSVAWTSLSQNSLTLKSGEKKTVAVTLTPPPVVTGFQKVDVTAKSTTSYATAKGTLTLLVRNCYDFSLSLQPSQGDICFGEQAPFTLEVKNLGDADSYTLELPGSVSANTTSLSVPSGKGTVSLTVTPAQKGLLPFDVTVKSSNDKNLSKKVSGSLNVKECRGLAVIISPAEKTVCKGEQVDYVVTIKNTGTISETFSLETNKGSLEKNSVTLAKGETKTSKLSLDTKNLTEDVVTVTASAEGISDSANTLLTAENCYDAAVDLSPATASVCPCSAVDYAISLENRGKLADTYLFTYSNVSENLTLQPGSKKEATFKVNVACEQKGSYAITGRAFSKNVDISASSDLAVKSKEACFGFEITNGKSASVEVFQGVAIPVKIKNTGEVEQEFSLSLAGPEWMFLSPKKLSLAPGSEEEVYVYATPPFGTDDGNYSALVTSSSLFAENDYEIFIAVGEGGIQVISPPEPEVPPTPPAENVTVGGEENITPPEEGITLKVTFENLTGELIKKTESPSIKTIAIGVITIVIIIILVIRFAILVKK